MRSMIRAGRRVRPLVLINWLMGAERSAAGAALGRTSWRVRGSANPGDACSGNVALCFVTCAL